MAAQATRRVTGIDVPYHPAVRTRLVAAALLLLLLLIGTAAVTGRWTTETGADAGTGDETAETARTTIESRAEDSGPTRQARSRATPPPPWTPPVDDCHVEFGGKGIRGRLVDEHGAPIAGVRVSVENIQIFAAEGSPAVDVDALRAASRGARFASASNWEFGTETMDPKTTTVTDEEGRFESRIPHADVDSILEHVTVAAFAPGRRPFRVRADLSTRTWESPTSLPHTAPERWLTLRWADAPIRFQPIRVYDMTDAARFTHPLAHTDGHGRLSTEWMEVGRRYALRVTRFDGAETSHFTLTYADEREIDLGELSAR